MPDDNQFNSQIENWMTQTLQANTVTTEDPVDRDGKPVDQNETPLPIPKTFVMALDEQQAQDERMASISRHRENLFGLNTKYRAYLDERVLKNPKSVFTAVNCPWHFAWFEDYDKSRDMQRLDSASADLLEMMKQEGYRPADFRKIGALHVVGEEAALIAIPRSANVLRALGAKNAGLRQQQKSLVPAPPQLPPHLWDKFGTILPPVISSDGSFWIGRHRLYMIESQVIKYRQMEMRALANGNLHKTGEGISQEADAFSGSFEIDLDAMFGGMGGMFGRK